MKHSRLSATQRGYGSRWQRYREKFLKANPLCVMHLSRGQTVASEVVDHIEPHKGSHRLFWNPINHQALCKQCHDVHKQRLEKSGVVLGCDERGIPIDPNHHWSKPRGV